MNFLKFSAAVLAVTCIASCNEKMITETPEGAGYITVTSQIGAQTKAGYETKTLPAEFIMDINQGNASFNYTKLKMSKDASSNEYTADKEDLKWVSTDHKGALVKAMTIPSGIATIDDDDIVNINLLSDQTTLDNFTKNDILGARNSEGGGITIKGDAINVSFQHLMSKLHVFYETSNTSVKVDAVTLNDVCLTGAYSYADINYVGSSDSRDNVNMLINHSTEFSITTAEAIFFPFVGKPSLVVSTSKGDKSCDIVSDDFTFERGKRYVLKIIIDENGNVEKSDIVKQNGWVNNVPGGKILWVGTSIPAGGGTIYSYPQMVSNATGLEVINNAEGGSVVTKPNQLNTPNLYSKELWDAEGIGGRPYNFRHLAFGGLSLTHNDMESYYSDLKQVMTADGKEGVDDEWVRGHINKLKELSYMSLIIPYIDGSRDNCQTVIIDHGFNDRANMYLESNVFLGYDTDPTTQYAEVYLDGLINQQTIGSGADSFVPNYDHYKAYLNNFWSNTENILTKDVSYLLAMESVINACREVNPNINIIIGNYFTEDNLWINYYDGLVETFGLRNFAKTICNYNRAAAKINNTKIVNVCDFLEVTNEQLWSGGFEFKEDGSVGAIVDPSKFCPDGVHPSSDGTGKSNKAIADIYLQELKRIFTETKSSDTFSCGWEDVEML